MKHSAPQRWGAFILREKMLSEFKKFILKGNIIELAVAVIIGAAFNQIVNSMVVDVITPLIGLIGGSPDFPL